MQPVSPQPMVSLAALVLYSHLWTWTRRSPPVKVSELFRRRYHIAIATTGVTLSRTKPNKSLFKSHTEIAESFKIFEVDKPLKKKRDYSQVPRLINL